MRLLELSKRSENSKSISINQRQFLSYSHSDKCETFLRISVLIYSIRNILIYSQLFIKICVIRKKTLLR